MMRLMLWVIVLLVFEPTLLYSQEGRLTKLDDTFLLSIGSDSILFTKRKTVKGDDKSYKERNIISRGTLLKYRKVSNVRSELLDASGDTLLTYKSTGFKYSISSKAGTQVSLQRVGSNWVVPGSFSISVKKKLFGKRRLLIEELGSTNIYIKYLMLNLILDDIIAKNKVKSTVIVVGVFLLGHELLS